MEVNISRHGDSIVLDLDGRIDAYGVKELDSRLEELLAGDEPICLIFEMSGVSYISSAGIRSIIKTLKALHKRGGELVLAAVSSYCRNVLDTAGMAGSLNMFADKKEAIAFLQNFEWERQALANWDKLEKAESPLGEFRFISGEAKEAELNITGNLADIVHSRIRPHDLYSRSFSQTEYSIGIGALGSSPEDYMDIMGLMTTIGGTMAWLPTDGHDLADFLVPRNDTGSVLIRTPYNISIKGGFNEYIMFESSDPEGTSLSQLYKGLFLLSRRRRKDFKGILGVSAIAEVKELYSRTLLKSPVIRNSPPAGKTIFDPENSELWFTRDSTPRYRDITCLSCGFGLDLSCDLSVFDPGKLYSAFYLDPAEAEDSGHILINHAAVFNKTEMPAKAASLDREIINIAEKGEFADMRSLDDRTLVSRAFIGVSYIQSLSRDLSGWHGRPGLNHPSRQVAEKRYREEAEYADIPRKRDEEINKFQLFLEAQKLKNMNKKQ
jgi:anti-anti-sigma factor